MQAKFNHTLSAILRGRWLIDKTYAASQMPFVMSLLNGNAVPMAMEDDDDEDQEARKRPVLYAAQKNVYSVRPYTDLSRIPDGSIAMVTISGPVLKWGDACSYGMVDTTQLINRLSASPNVSGILLNLDSPGGQADGTAMLSDAIKAAGKNKPVVAIVDDGMAASAAMWIASAANEIYVSQPTDQVGSIGVYTTIADWNAYYKNEGLPVADVYAPQSKDKNGDYRQAIESAFADTSAIEADLAVLADQFINTVAANRTGKIKGENWKTGKMFYAKDAQRIGLIDGIKNLEQVIRRMNSMISNKQKSNTNTMAFEKTRAAAKADAFAVVAAGDEVTDGGFLVSEEMLNNVEANITALESAVGEAQASTATANETIASLQGQLDAALAAGDNADVLASKDETISQLTTKVADLEAQVALLGKTPSGTGTTVVSGADAIPGASAKPSWWKPDGTESIAKRYEK